MRWTLAGYCGLALISLSVALQINQKPRFYGVKTNFFVWIYCQSSQLDQNSTVQWYKADQYDAEKKEIQGHERIRFQAHSMIQNALLHIDKLQVEDGGVYFCKIEETWGPGTQLQVVRHINLHDARHRSNVKDGLIVVQGLMLAVCIAAIIRRKQKLLGKSDSVYEEPETDHIYEGLAIETCGGELYEDLTAYQAGGTEAPWE